MGQGTLAQAVAQSYADGWGVAMDAKTLAEWESLPHPRRLQDDGIDDNPAMRFSVLAGGQNWGIRGSWIPDIWTYAPTLAEAIHKAALKVAALGVPDSREGGQ